MMENEAKSSQNSPEPGGQKVFVFVNFVSVSEVEELKLKARTLGGQVVENAVTWDPRISHVISKNFVKSEMVLAGLAAGRWILTREFVDDSCDQQSWVDPLNYVHDQCVIRNVENWKHSGHGPFHNYKSMFLMDDLDTKEMYQRILEAGGGKVQKASLQEALREKLDSSHLTHIIADPCMLEAGDPRYEEFQQWLNYERKVTLQKTMPVWSNGFEGTWKIIYIFLLHKLTSLQPVEEVHFDISMKNIKKEARARARLSRQIKVEEEEEEVEEKEKELTILKENKRNHDRSYLDKPRGENPEVWPKTEEKRKADWEDDISSKGGWGTSQKRQRRSAGPYIQADYEFSQNLYLRNLRASIRAIEEAGNNQDFSGMRRIFGVKQQAVSSQPSRRDVKWRKEETPIITLEDSDCEVEIKLFPELGGKKHENDMSSRKPVGRPPEIVLKSGDQTDDELVLIPTLGECTLSKESIVDLSVEETDTDQSQGSIALLTTGENLTKVEEDLEVTCQFEDSDHSQGGDSLASAHSSLESNKSCSKGSKK